MTSLTLVGGGTVDDPRVWLAFVADAAARAAGGVPRIAIVTVRGRRNDGHAAQLVAALRSAGAIEPVITALREGDVLDSGRLDDVHGLLVGGGLTPAYLDALAPHADRIRTLVEDGLPYAGFSAGSMIAAERAIVGGWRVDGRAVAPEDTAEDLDAVTVLPGLGLTGASVDVHAGAWGTLSRLVAAVGAGLVPDGVAIDEDTAVVVRGRKVAVVGTGAVWWVAPAPGGTTVRRQVAV